jgi:hypothetical protein
VASSPDKLYSATEIANILDWEVATLAAYRCRPGGIPFFKLGRTVMYRGSDLIAHIEGSRQEAGADPARSQAARARALLRNGRAA